jgi:hypothetical protein
LQRDPILSELSPTRSMELRMFAVPFSRHQEPAAAVMAKADPDAFDRMADDDAAEHDHSLPVPWEWWADGAAAN